MGASHSRANKAHEKAIDFENAKPSGQEQQTFDAAGQILAEGPEVLRKIEEYQGCQEQARVAMSTPTKENEQAAFEALLWAVDSISHFFSFSQALEKMVPELLLQLAKEPLGDKEAAQPALLKQLAQVLDFVLQFDQKRMMTPHLSNDFSYYRRLLPKFNKHPSVRVKDDEASGMALFTAEHIPMMKCLAKGAARAFDRDEDCAVAVSVLANSCLRMARDGKWSNPQTALFNVRAMAGALVLFDHMVPAGAFTKKSPIPAGAVIQLLQRDYPNEGSLLNAIRFSTKTFRTAPDSVQNLFD